LTDDQNEKVNELLEEFDDDEEDQTIH